MKVIAIIVLVISSLVLSTVRAENNKMYNTIAQEEITGPRKNKNYRTKMAMSYFGSAGKCRNWKRFCGK